jgi:cation diffusion facilitator family transporter
MDACCEQKAEEIQTLRDEHRKVLIVVLVINAVLFVVEAGAGLLAHSTALLADSLDMLGDSLVYGFSLYVLWRSAEWRATAALLKGLVMAAFGIGVLAEAAYKVTAAVVPVAETMGIIGLLVLLGNGLCFLLLFRHRSDDLNMRSTWLCSRNDIVANVSVLVAAGGVAYFRSIWPDVLVGGIIAALFLRTALTVLSESIHEYRELRAAPEGTSYFK